MSVRLALKNQNINWSKNFICNGDFIIPIIPEDRKWQHYWTIPCWSTDGKFEITEGNHHPDMKTQDL